MNISIQSHGFPLTTGLENHVRRRLRYVLSRHNESIDSIAVDLRRGFGTASGFESSCVIRADLIDRPLPAITERGTDIYVVSDRGVDRIGRLITQALHDGLHASWTAARTTRPAPTGRLLRHRGA